MVQKAKSVVQADIIPGILGGINKLCKAIGVKGKGEKTRSEKDTNDKTKSKSKNKPKEKGEPNSVEVQRDSNGKITKYTEYGPNGKIVKEVRLTEKDHGNVPRPNVKEPNYHTNPISGEQFQNGYKVRPAEPWEIPK